MNNTCKHCKHWGASWEGVCDRIGLSEPSDKDKAKIIVRVSDDSGLSAKLVTSPDFGCALFAAKDAENKG